MKLINFFKIIILNLIFSNSLNASVVKYIETAETVEEITKQDYIRKSNFSDKNKINSVVIGIDNLK